MSGYDFFERKLARVLSYIPAIEKIAKYCYSRCNAFGQGMTTNSRLSAPILCILLIIGVVFLATTISNLRMVNAGNINNIIFLKICLSLYLFQ